MRQATGSEILGANNPRSAEIGIIHVSPLDDRQSVLAAILTQERLGRKQVVVVLPEGNKAFQHPVDFDGLKKKRREMQAQIIFVAPSGPGPALLARQRHFPVYSSLENYARTFQDTADEQGENGKSARPGWLFSRKQKQDTNTATPPSNGVTQPAPVILQPLTTGTMPDATVPTDWSGQVDPTDRPNQAEQSAEAPLADMDTDNFDDELPPANHDAMAMPPAQNNGTGMLEEDENEEDEGDGEDEQVMPLILPLPAVAPDPVPAAHSATAHADLVGAGNGKGPNIIELSPRRTGTTGKMPVPAAQSDPQSDNTSKKSYGKKAAFGTIGSVAAATATTRAFQAKRVASNAGSGSGSGMSTATMAQTAHGGSPIPPRGGAGRPGGPGGPGRSTGRNWLIAAGLLLLTLLFAFGAVAYAAPGILGHFSNIVPGNPLAAKAVVTITPATKTIPVTYEITAVTGTPNPSNRQVQARILSDNPSKSQTVTATGIKKTPGARATGTLTFYNASTSEFTVAAGTLFATGSGVQLVNDSPAFIPAANPPSFGSTQVSAHAVNVGAGGNIPAFAISGTCCSGTVTIYVKNLTPFTGGQDPQNYTYLQQSDVDNVATPLQKQLTASAQANVEGQKHSGEQFVNASNNPISCNPSVTANPPVGSKTSSATVTVQVSCSGEVYDQQAAQAMAVNLYKNDTTINHGPGFVLTGNVSSSFKQIVQVDNKTGTITLAYEAVGTWAYQTSLLVAQENLWARQIAGKSQQQAKTYLQGQTGVGSVSIQYGSNTLPTDPSQITFIIGNAPLPGSPTPTTPGPSPVPGTPSGGTPTPTPTSQNGLGSK